MSLNQRYIFFIQGDSALIKIWIADTYISNFSLIHFRKKDCEFFSQIFKKLQILANFFTTLLKVIFRNCEKNWSYAPHVEKT